MSLIEILEPRRLLSASATVYSKVLTRDASSDIQGFTPSQISLAYGFNTVASPNPSIKPDGSGQTIAIVDAFADPKIAADLGVFDEHFALPAPPQFKIVNQTGGSHLPAANAGWASEISLDVEWAHAMAPGANLLLVEARSGSKSDLTTAAHFAAAVPGVSVVSISWGFNESAAELKMDRSLQTPAGHAGVTFVAAGGDNGMAEGAGWPAESPGVLSVGGTTLTLANSGAYQSEIAWSETGGGYSSFEQEPPYQYAAQQSGTRSTPDVAYDGDPNTGFAVYDSIPYQGTQGWQVIAGNSAGAPQWGAIVAIANQARAENGLASLDGASQTLPLLYSVLSSTGATANPQYAATFNDINDTTSGDGLATPGYDTATGLGTPKVPQVVSLLSSASIPSETAVGAPIAAVFAGIPPVVLAPGHQTAVTLDLWDQNTAPLKGTVDIELYYSSKNTLDGTASPLTGESKLALRLSLRQHKRIRLGFAAPDTISPGHDLLLASISFSPIAAGRPIIDIAFVGTTSPATPD